MLDEIETVNGSISGTITDASGAVIPSATVTATNEETSQTRSVAADSEGKYLIANLSAGNYTVRVEASVFKATVRTSVPVKANTTTKVDFILEVGGVSEVVNVTGSTESLRLPSFRHQVCFQTTHIFDKH